MTTHDDSMLSLTSKLDSLEIDDPVLSLVRELDRFKYILGFDFGAISSGASIALINDSSKIYTVNQWIGGGKGKSPAMKQRRKQKPEQYPTSVLYENGDRESICIGISEEKVLTLSESDVYIPDIKKYLLDPRRDVVNQEMGRILAGLTIDDVVTDYLREFHDLAISRLREDTSFQKSSEKFTEDFKPENIRYCLACPKDQKEFMKQRFIEAGIIYEDEQEYRLAIVTESEATAYNCLNWNRQQSEINPEEHHLVCDIGHTSVRISKFRSGSTEYFSKVEPISETFGGGSMALENYLKDYLQDNATRLNLDDSIIEGVVKEFIGDIKFTFDLSDEDLCEAEVQDLNTPDDEFSDYSAVFNSVQTINSQTIKLNFADLNRHVFSRAISNIINLILEAVYNNDTDYKKIFLSGKYGSQSYLVEKLKTMNYGKFERAITVIDHNSIDSVSRGAVMFGLRKKDSQIPYLDETPKPMKKSDSNYGNDGDDIDNSKFDFIVGIDFGTTYSGCSYTPINKNGEINPIKTIKTNWPGDNNQGFGKTPTLLIYNNDSKKMTYWGQEARDHMGEGSLFGNFKLFLSPDASRNYYGKGNQEIFNKWQKTYKYAKNKLECQTGDKIDAVDVIADYLRLFNTHVIKQIEEREAKKEKYKQPAVPKKKTKAKLKLRYVITVPAMWNAPARETMAEAAIKANIVKRGDLQNLLIISEPEAAALYCENRYKDFVKTDKMHFIVCDAGGGTVDLVTFLFTVDETTKEFIIRQIGDGEGDICGSTYLDANFRDYILRFYRDIGKDEEVIKKIDLDEVIKDFINDKKPNFTADNLPIVINLPAKPEITDDDVKNAKKTYKLGTNNRTLIIESKTMESEIFNPIMDKIEALLDKQKNKLKDETIGTIILVGGFSQSKYLQQRLRRRYEPDIKVGFPPDGVTAISHGAVSYAQNPRMISRKVAGQSLAIEVQAEFDREKGDPHERKVVKADGKEYVKSRLEYFVKKNQQLKENEISVYETVVYIEYPKNAIIAIYSCNADDKELEKKPTTWRYANDQHIKIIEMNVNVPLLPAKKKDEKIRFKVTLEINNIGITVTVECLDKAIINSITKEISDQEILRFVSRSSPMVLKNKRRPVEFTLANHGYLFNSSSE